MLRPASYHKRQRQRQFTHVTLLCVILLWIAPLIHGDPALGRATFYGAGDGFTLNDGSCACHKRWGWLSNRCESGQCFDYVGKPSAVGPDYVTARSLQEHASTGIVIPESSLQSPTQMYAAHLRPLHTSSMM